MIQSSNPGARVTRRSALSLAIAATLSTGAALAAPPDPVTHPDDLVVTVGGAKWLTARARFHGDDNGNGYTRFYHAKSASGPWTEACAPGQPGNDAWRACTVAGLTPGSAVFVRAVFHDSDGVVPVLAPRRAPRLKLLPGAGAGAAPSTELVRGPFQLAAAVQNAAQFGPSSLTVEDTHMLLRQEIRGDDNLNAGMRVDIGRSASGPWTEKCGPPSTPAPKLCRLHGLEPGTAYHVRVTAVDPDGSNLASPRVLGPVTYTGLSNRAFERPVTAGRGWGCCTDPRQLTDGRIMRPNWQYGFAIPGGKLCYAGGCPPGFKALTIDLGAAQDVARFDAWMHDANNTPLVWRVSTSRDNVSFAEVYSSSQPVCRTDAGPLNVNWATPSCSLSARFAPVSARYVRFEFDDRTLLDGIHGWFVQTEVFGPAPATPDNQPPVANAGAAQSVVGGGSVRLSAAGSFDPEGGALTYAWRITSPLPDSGAPRLLDATTATPTFVAGAAGEFALALLVTDALGATATATTKVTVTAPTVDRPPEADAGPDRSVAVGSTVSLDFSRSVDPDRDPLQAKAVVISRPSNSRAEPSSVSPTLRASFTPDVAGRYVIRLTVTAGGKTSTDDVVITASVAPPPPPSLPRVCFHTLGQVWYWQCGPEQGPWTQITQTVSGFASVREFRTYNNVRLATWAYQQSLPGGDYQYFARCTDGRTGMVAMTERTQAGFDFIANFTVSGANATWQYCTSRGVCTPRTKRLPVCN